MKVEDIKKLSALDHLCLIFFESTERIKSLIDIHLRCFHLHFTCINSTFRKHRLRWLKDVQLTHLPNCDRQKRELNQALNLYGQEKL